MFCCNGQFFHNMVITPCNEFFIHLKQLISFLKPQQRQLAFAILNNHNNFCSFSILRFESKPSKTVLNYKFYISALIASKSHHKLKLCVQLQCRCSLLWEPTSYTITITIFHINMQVVFIYCSISIQSHFFAVHSCGSKFISKQHRS